MCACGSVRQLAMLLNFLLAGLLANDRLENTRTSTLLVGCYARLGMTIEDSLWHVGACARHTMRCLGVAYSV
jgi:hypothetical protein